MDYWSLVPTDLHGLNIIVEWHIYEYFYKVFIKGFASDFFLHFFFFFTRKVKLMAKLVNN